MTSDSFRNSAYEILAPKQQTCPLVLASPHSGADYPSEFQAQARLSLLELRRSEDSFVDEIFAAAPELGIPLLRACFPRALIDVNREPYELDPTMFQDPLPIYANTTSVRVAAGLGTVAKLVANGLPIYHQKLTFAEALARIESYYHPYHAALSGLIENTLNLFGVCLLLDCHSMPSMEPLIEPSSQKIKKKMRMNWPKQFDIVLGDSHGATCHETVIHTAEVMLEGCGYHVMRNDPYAGGYTTCHYGQPLKGVHALQIEINRALYMDEQTIRRTNGIDRLVKDMTALMIKLSQIKLNHMVI